jgi:hypothetical protein
MFCQLQPEPPQKTTFPQLQPRSLQPAHQVYLQFRGTAGQHRQHTVRQLTSQATMYTCSTEVQHGSTDSTLSASSPASPPVTYSTEVQQGSTATTPSASSPASPPGIPIAQRYSRAAQLSHRPPAHQPAHQAYLKYRGKAGQHSYHNVRQLTSQSTRYTYSTEVQQDSTDSTLSANSPASPPGIPTVQRYSRAAQTAHCLPAHQPAHQVYL